MNDERGSDGLHLQFRLLTRPHGGSLEVATVFVDLMRFSQWPASPKWWGRVPTQLERMPCAVEIDTRS